MRPFDGARRGLLNAPDDEPRADVGGGAGYRASAVEPVPPAVEREFLDWLLRLADIDPRRYRSAVLARRLPACLRAIRAAGLPEARARILRDSANLAPAVSAVLIGTTGFFRDAEVFRALARIIGDEMRSRSSLRVWSAGASDGAELASVGMLLSEAGLLTRATLLGTDCRNDAVRSAASGRYAERSTEDLPVGLREKYFEAAPRAGRDSGEPWMRIRDPLRSSMRWRRGDINRVVEPGAWDLILCRNVAIYLGDDAIRELWQRLSTALAPGGYLVVGRAERPKGFGGLEYVDRCVYRRPPARRTWLCSPRAGAGVDRSEAQRA